MGERQSKEKWIEDDMKRETAKSSIAKDRTANINVADISFVNRTTEKDHWEWGLSDHSNRISK